MATPRLTFLYPHFFKPLRITHESLAYYSKPHFYTSRRSIANRHGSAVEHPPFGVPPLARSEKPGSSPISDSRKGDDSGASSLETSKQTEPVGLEKNDQSTDTTKLQEEDLTGEKTIQEQPPSTDQKGPLDPLLQNLPPTSLQSPSHQPPTIKSPPYIHHFDTYTFVHLLTAATIPPNLSLTTMKAIRSLLAHHLSHAQAVLLPTSSLSNQSYLFTSAISELRTEIQNSRAHEAEQLRSARNRLQHEVDILNQRLDQELAALREELKGLFGDRRMAVRMEQREMEGRIQELNYKITVMLGSDMKSEVEGLRWVLTRRAALAIFTMAFLILGSLRYWSYRSHYEQQQHHQPPKQPEVLSGREGSDVLIEPKG
ncbi:hypothetical protein FGG08_002292 [Glutinoglossum americanum]|uniref:Uncharacterized protein n=1 Tax=Glutinoglossum americanum TaxID=1670608 RepID=A0A9P8L5N7_9PEZI|nr:hypothetical protein FGG08_002292 [Glutinoglossum americanum]